MDYANLVEITPYKETGGGDKSIFDCLDPDYCVPWQVITYLKKGDCLFACPGIYDDPFQPGKRLFGPYILSDGRYAWDSRTWWYVSEYGLKLPQDFIDYVMSEERLEWLYQQIAPRVYEKWLKRRLAKQDNSCETEPAV